MSSGIVKSCAEKKRRVVMNGIKLTNQNKLRNIYGVSSRDECYGRCESHIYYYSSVCFAVSVSLKDRASYTLCSSYGDGDVDGKGQGGAVIVDPNTRKSIQYTAEKGSSTSTVIINTRYLQLYIHKVRILNLRVRETITTTTDSSTETSEENCLKKCNGDPLCSVFTFKLTSGGKNCWTYFEDSVTCENDESSTPGAMRARRSESCENLFVANGYATTFMPYKSV